MTLLSKASIPSSFSSHLGSLLFSILLEIQLEFTQVLLSSLITFEHLHAPSFRT